MLVTIVGNHTRYADVLAEKLGGSHKVVGHSALKPGETLVSDVVVTARLSAEEAGRVRCRLLHVPGAGLDAIALDQIASETLVCNAYEHEGPIAEYVTHAVLDHSIFPEGSSFPMGPGEWGATHAHRAFHREVMGQTVGIIGYGRIGQAVGARLSALGMHVTAITSSGVSSGVADDVRPIADLMGVLPMLDVLVVSCPLNEKTRGLIGADQLACMRRDALLINIARGAIIEQRPLFEALQARNIGRAVLDVWYRYPKNAEDGVAASDYDFSALPNARCTPHISGWTFETIARRYAIIAENIWRLEEGEPLINLVSRT